MATTTTNFGWDIPQSTDLVKDGATAIAALGQDIDTALVDLKGGTTGQVLAKASGTDLDFTWVAQDDSNAIQNAIVDAKGDLISATGNDTPARLAVGTNGQVLTADSTTATGLKWNTPASGVTFSGVAVNRSSDLSTNTGTVTTITFDTEIYDTDGYHSTSTNTERLTVPTGKSGYYLWNTQGAWATNTTGLRQFIFYKNGTRLNTPPGYESITSSAGFAAITRSYVLNLTAGDYVEVRAFQSSGGTLAVRVDELQMSLTYLGA